MAKAAGARGRPASTKRVPAAVPAVGAYPAGAPLDPRVDLLATAVLAALKVALDALPSPALVTGRNGQVVCANVNARVVLGEGGLVARWPVSDDDPVGSSSRWEVIPIQGAGPDAWLLLILSSRQAQPPRHWSLTDRQTEVVNLIVRGLTNTGIAETLGIRLGTVEFHISAIFDKVGVYSRAALIATVIGQ